MNGDNGESADTCGCPASQDASPWDRQSAITNQVLMGAPVLVGTAALWRYRWRKLLVFLPAVTAFLTVWRRWTCARCQYYGTECSTLLGIATAKMMPRDTEHELDRNMMTLDFAFLGAVMLIPLRQVLKSKLLTAAYLLGTVAGFYGILKNACPRCGNEFCPMKDLAGRL
jgi:hypothetical protein